MNAFSLLMKRRAALADLLPVIAFAFATAITLTVFAGTLAFRTRGIELGVALGMEPPVDVALTPEQFVLPIIEMLALVACMLLIPSAVALGGSAARLSLTRREKDLAAVRLVGGTRMQVAGIAIADVMIQAALGAVLGVGIHFVVAAPLSLLDFGIHKFGATDLILPWWALLLSPLLLALLAAGSAALTLTGVAFSPLGIARGAHVVRMSVLRVLAWAAMIIAFVLVAQYFSSGDSELPLALIILILFGMVGTMVVSVNIAGPFFIWILAKIIAALAPSPALLVGARRLAADPRAGWRTISGVTVALTVAGIASAAGTFPVTDLGPEGEIFIKALVTGAFLTVGIAAVLAAVGTGVSHTARVIDQAPQYRAQYVAGASIAQLHRARIAEIAIPVAVAFATATLMALITIGNLTAQSLTNPGLLVGYVVAIVGSLALVTLSGLVSSPLVARAAREGRR